MSASRSLRLDLFALLLLAGAVLLGASLFSYDAADPPSTLIHPPRTEIANACGRAGAYVAHFLIASVGFGAFYVMTSLAALAVTLLWRQEVNQPIVRGAGWVASLAAASTIAAMALPHTSPGPEIGAGGYLGAMGFAVLESYFAAVGAYILALAILLAGLLLCTDYLIFRFAAATTAASSSGLVQVGRLGGRAASLGRPATTDQDPEEEGELDDGDEWEVEDGNEEGEWEDGEYDEDEEYEDDDEEYEEYEDDDEPLAAEDEDEEPAAAGHALKVRTPADKAEAAEESKPAESAGATRGLKDKLTSALRIKNPNDKRREHEEIIQQLEAADHESVDEVDYQLPPLDLLLQSEDICYEEHEKEVRRKAKVLEKTFRSFGLNVKVVEIETGPVIAQYEIALEAGLRLSKITGLADDLAIALRVPSVRIVAPIPGKNTVGIEVPNETRQLVRLRDVIEETNGRAKRMKIPVYLGKDVAGNAMAVDLAALPHLLIAGRTGTGKSVCLNTIIVSMLMSRGPDEVRMLMIDPKMVELSGYKKLPHLMHPVVTDMRKAEAILAWAVDKMEERYQMLARAGVRHVSVYNQLSEEELRDRMQPKSDAEWENVPKNLPFIVIVADEMADLMMTAGKEVEQHIIRLAQKSRAVGIHLILATQKPTVDVITGLIKSNLPARIAFQVASRTDSRVVLDENGADKLLGNGDMLFLSPGTSQLLRGQGTFVSDDEITRVTDFVGTDAPQFAKELIELKVADEQDGATGPAALKDRDELYEAAVDVVIREQRGSVSLLQRCLGIGYGRAARLIDYMAEDGIVADYNGAKAREVLMTLADWEAMQNGDEPPPEPDQPLTVATVEPKPKRHNRILPGDDDSRIDDRVAAKSPAPIALHQEAVERDDSPVAILAPPSSTTVELLDNRVEVENEELEDEVVDEAEENLDDEVEGEWEDEADDHLSDAEEEADLGDEGADGDEELEDDDELEDAADEWDDDEEEATDDADEEDELEEEWEYEDEDAEAEEEWEDDDEEEEASDLAPWEEEEDEEVAYDEEDESAEDDGEEYDEDEEEELAEGDSEWEEDEEGEWDEEEDEECDEGEEGEWDEGEEDEWDEDESELEENDELEEEEVAGG